MLSNFSAAKSVRKQRKLSYQQNLKKLQDIEARWFLSTYSLRKLGYLKLFLNIRLSNLKHLQSKQRRKLPRADQQASFFYFRSTKLLPPSKNVILHFITTFHNNLFCFLFLLLQEASLFRVSFKQPNRIVQNMLLNLQEKNAQLRNLDVSTVRQDGIHIFQQPLPIHNLIHNSSRHGLKFAILYKFSIFLILVLFSGNRDVELPGWTQVTAS